MCYSLFHDLWFKTGYHKSVTVFSPLKVTFEVFSWLIDLIHILYGPQATVLMAASSKAINKKEKVKCQKTESRRKTKNPNPFKCTELALITKNSIGKYHFPITKNHYKFSLERAVLFWCSATWRLISDLSSSLSSLPFDAFFVFWSFLRPANFVRVDNEQLKCAHFAQLETKQCCMALHTYNIILGSNLEDNIFMKRKTLACYKFIWTCVYRCMGRYIQVDAIKGCQLLLQTLICL